MKRYEFTRVFRCMQFRVVHRSTRFDLPGIAGIHGETPCEGFFAAYSRTPRKRTPLGPPRSVRLRGVSANGGLKFQKELKGQEQ